VEFPGLGDPATRFSFEIDTPLHRDYSLHAELYPYTHNASYGSDPRPSREFVLAKRIGPRPILVLFPFAPANVWRDDGFSNTFAHCEVESFVELDALPNFEFAPGQASIQNAKRSATRK
jgi:hypothetical protein